MPKLLKKNARTTNSVAQMTRLGSGPSNPTNIRFTELLKLVPGNTSVSFHFVLRKPLTFGANAAGHYWINVVSTSETVTLADWYGKQMVHEKIDALRRKVNGFARMSRNWDTHGAGPIPRSAIDDALRLLDLLEKEQIVPNAAIPTSDESILVRYEHGLETFKWEFSGKGEIAFVKVAPDGHREYLDVAPDFQELPA